MQAVSGMGAEKPTAPYDLSLSFTEVAATTQLVAIAADGSSYTGGAHGNPLVARFVWLPREDRQLTAAELVPDAKSWREISDYVREQLQTALSQRVDADKLPPDDRVEIVKGASRMIDEGTTPSADSFAQFEPVLGAGRAHRGAAVRVPAVPGGSVCRWDADRRRSIRRAAAPHRTHLPASVRRRLIVWTPRCPR